MWRVAPRLKVGVVAGIAGAGFGSYGICKFSSWGSDENELGLLNGRRRGYFEGSAHGVRCEGKYDKLAAKYPGFVETFQDHVLDMTRVARTLFVFSQLVLEYKVLKWKSKGLDDAEECKLRHAANNKGAGLVLELCRRNGGIFIKLGQHAASLKNAIPVEYIKTLQVLQDNAPPRPMEDVYAVIDANIGLERFHALVEEIDEVPMGCASLAQVHKAKLKDGNIVALKIQHRNLRKVVASDVTLFKYLNWTVSKLFADEGFSLAWALNEFEQNLRQELDFLEEASNCEECRHNFGNDQTLRNKVVVPKIYWGLTSDQTICMDFIRGVPIHNVDELKNRKVDLPQLASVVLEAFAAMIFVYGFVHCDPHPGNLMVIEKHHSKTGRVQLALLDHGLYRRLDEGFRNGNCELWQSMILQNKDTLKRVCTSMGMPALWQIMPFLFVNRSVDTVADLGESVVMSAEEKTKLRERLGISNFSFADVGSFANELPNDMVLVLKTMHLIKDLNDSLGGNNRDRFLTYAKYAVYGSNPTTFGFASHWPLFLLRFYCNELWGGLFRQRVDPTHGQSSMEMSQIVGTRAN